jgi:N-acetylneuraminic acid mutarotase
VEKAWRWARRHPAVAGLLLVILLLLTTVAVLLTPEPDVPSFPFRTAQGASGVIDGKLYVVTPVDGYGSGGLDYFHVCDPDKQSWQQLAVASVPTPHTDPAAAVIGRKLYLVGGWDMRGRPFGRLDVFDAGSQTWSTAAPMPTPRVSAAAAVLDGKLYILGGNDGTNVLAIVEVYDPATGLWTRGPNMPVARSGFLAAALNGELYAVSGHGSGGEWLTSVDIYNPAQGRWRPGPAMPQAAVSAFGVAYKNVLYVAGGWGGQGGSKLAGSYETGDFMAYDLATRQWRMLPPMPDARRTGDGAQVLNGRIHVIGGWRSREANGGSGLPHNEVFKFNIAKGAWEVPKKRSP